jgi:hypothetical protein
MTVALHLPPLLLTFCKDQGKNTGKEGCAAVEQHSELLGILLTSLWNSHHLPSIFDAVEPSTGKIL